jgi:hypothetical protein
VSVDTYLGEKPEPRPVEVERSLLGVRDLVLRPASLDPRLEGGVIDPEYLHVIRPVADAGEDLTIEPGTDIILDARNSRAARGRDVARYIWTWIQ